MESGESCNMVAYGTPFVSGFPAKTERRLSSRTLCLRGGRHFAFRVLPSLTGKYEIRMRKSGIAVDIPFEAFPENLESWRLG